MKAIHLLVVVAVLSPIKLYLLLKAGRNDGKGQRTIKASLFSFGLALISLIIIPLILLIMGYISKEAHLLMVGLFALVILSIIYLSRKAL
ncbi:MAG: hypothetical protein QMD53_06085 [Actinomycetota bacterium]|nr:hypothetical protein [Actinomycetota bacterium]